MEMVEIPCNFVGRFKVGDNLVANASILRGLVERNDDGLLNKPIILQCGSILEAALAEIIYRAQNFNREGVPNVSEKERQEIESRVADKFAVIIDVLRKYRILDDLGNEIYVDLHKLRNYRNKIHIQLVLKDIPNDDQTAFSTEIREWALRLNFSVLRHLSEKYPRPKHIEGYVASLRVPAL